MPSLFKKNHFFVKSILREILEEDEPITKEHFLNADSMKELLDINMECRRIWSNDMFQSDLDFDKENTPMKFLIK